MEKTKLRSKNVVTELLLSSEHSLKQIFGQMVWTAGFMTMAFLLLDIPCVCTGIENVPYWPVYGIKMLGRDVGEKLFDKFLILSMKFGSALHKIIKFLRL